MLTMKKESNYKIITMYSWACYTHRRDTWAAFKNFNEIDFPRYCAIHFLILNYITLSIKLLTCGAIIMKRIIAVVAWTAKWLRKAIVPREILRILLIGRARLFISH